MTQVAVGFLLGGQAYSQIIFFENKRAFDEFTSGNFEFSSVQASTTGSSATASGTRDHAKHRSPGYYDGMAIFTVAKGGLMYEASVGGQKFTYDARKK
jgi:hypothetical protein